MGCSTLRIEVIQSDFLRSNALLMYKWNGCVLNLGTTFENPVLSQDFIYTAAPAELEEQTREGMNCLGSNRKA